MVNTASFFRALDDSGLDVYETRFLMRVWRRGTCWEKLENISEATGMSIGKASQVRKELLSKGWLTKVVADGRVAYHVAIPNVAVFQDVKQDAEEFHEVKPTVEVFHVVEPEFQDVKQEFHTVKPEFHVVDALPINRQKEDHTIKCASTPPADDEHESKQRAWEATVELIEFWEGLTKRRRPTAESADFRDKWLKPFNEIWIACGRDTVSAKAKIAAVRDGMLSQGGRIFDPAKLPGHVQALIDAERLPPSHRTNGHGKPSAPKSVSTPAPGSQPVLW